MAQIDHSDLLRIVKDFRANSASYQRQFVFWLGVGSAGGIAILLSFATNLPDPDFALDALSPSLIAFSVGTVFAAATILALALRESASATHYGEAFNREQFERAIVSTPQFISSPESIAERMNQNRNKLITQNHLAHSRAEKAWTERHRWQFAYAICVIVSTSGFIVGIAWPIIYLESGGRFVSPVASAPQSRTEEWK